MFPAFFSRAAVTLSKMPILRRPPTATISEKSSISTVRLIYPPYCLSGLTKKTVTRAAKNAIARTGWDLINFFKVNHLRLLAWQKFSSELPNYIISQTNKKIK